MPTPTTLKYTLPTGQAYVINCYSRRDATASMVNILAEHGYQTSRAALNQAFHRDSVIIRAGIKFEIFDISESAEIKIAPIMRPRASPYRLRELQWLKNKVAKYESALYTAREKCMDGTLQNYSDAQMAPLLARFREAKADLELAKEALANYYGTPEK